jgi:integrase
MAKRTSAPGHGRVRLNKRGTWWYARFQAEGKRRELPLRVTNKVVAEDLAHKINAALEEGSPWQYALGRAQDGELTVKGFIYDHFLPRFCDWGEKTRQCDAGRLGILTKEFGTRPLSSVTPEAIKAWLSRLEAEGRSAATSNRYLSLFKSIYKAAVGYGFCPSNPAAEVKMQAEPIRTKDILSTDEFERLLCELPVYSGRVVLTAAETGMRRGELERLLWEDVDMAAGELRVAEAKNKEFRIVPFTTRLRDLLTSMRAEVMPHPKAPVFADGVEVRKELTDALERAKIEKRVTLHSFRHQFATQALEAGMSSFHLQAIGGWKSPVMLQRYGKVRNAALHQEMAKLNA